ncbi:MAG TPA: dTMP kinase, partial [Gaiellales bacterium]|nr:dTMP kinase [Gaiellales bacterium]
MFISFEGLDGCGKTTQAAMLATALELEGRTVVRVREPGGTPIGERIRELLLDGDSVIGGAAEALLYAAARAQLVDQVILPALA